MLYILLTYYYLPNFVKTLKFRKKLIEINEFKRTTILNKLHSKKLQILGDVHKDLLILTNSSIYFHVFKFTKLIITTKKSISHKLDNNFIYAGFRHMLYCNKFNLSKIQFYPSLYNLKKIGK